MSPEIWWRLYWHTITMGREEISCVSLLSKISHAVGSTASWLSQETSLAKRMVA
jgi:hypothetical protein